MPLLGLFKERAEGSGHSYGTTAVRGFVDMTEEAISFGDEGRPENPDMTDPAFLRSLPLHQLEGAFGLDDEAYQHNSFEEMTPRAINSSSSSSSRESAKTSRPWTASMRAS